MGLDKLMVLLVEMQKDLQLKEEVTWNGRLNAIGKRSLSVIAGRMTDMSNVRLIMIEGYSFSRKTSCWKMIGWMRSIRERKTGYTEWGSSIKT